MNRTENPDQTQQCGWTPPDLSIDGVLAAVEAAQLVAEDASVGVGDGGGSRKQLVRQGDGEGLLLCAGGQAASGGDGPALSAHRLWHL